jgi:hypothetical protein
MDQEPMDPMPDACNVWLIEYWLQANYKAFYDIYCI